MKSAVCGKTMENLRNRINVKLVNNKKDYLKWTSKPSYMPHKIFDNDLASKHKNKVTVTLKKFPDSGMCIFKLSKVLMYEFYYNYIKHKYGNNSRLLFTDTDKIVSNLCLIYEIETEDVYEDFINDKEMFDFRNFSTKSKHI